MAVTGLNRELALSRVGGDLDLLKEIAIIFLEDVPRTMAEIRQAIVEKDFEVLERSAHGLKGAAANFGADEVVSMALQLETLGRAQSISGAEAAFSALEQSLIALRTELEAFQIS